MVGKRGGYAQSVEGVSHLAGRRCRRECARQPIGRAMNKSVMRKTLQTHQKYVELSIYNKPNVDTDARTRSSMSVFKFDNNSLNDAKPLSPVSLASVKLEEYHIRDFLAERLWALEEDGDLLAVATEYGSWEDSKRRLDILAIEPTEQGGRLVVIELKRDDGGAHAELQALRYAAMVATHSFSHVVEAFAAKCKKTNPSFTRADAEAQLLEFLGKSNADEVSLSNNPRIILIAPSFSKELTTTVLWLTQQAAVDIACYTVDLYDLGDGSKVLSFDKLLPLPVQEEYLVKVRAKAVQDAAQEQSKAQKAARTISILEEHGYLNDGDELTLLVLPQNQMNLSDDKKKARYRQGGKVEWLYTGETFNSLTALTKHICQEELGKSYSIQGPAYWGKDGVTLYDMAKQIGTAEVAGSPGYAVALPAAVPVTPAS